MMQADVKNVIKSNMYDICLNKQGHVRRKCRTFYDILCRKTFKNITNKQLYRRLLDS